jgi:hypothetical protein
VKALIVWRGVGSIDYLDSTQVSKKLQHGDAPCDFSGSAGVAIDNGNQPTIVGDFEIRLLARPESILDSGDRCPFRQVIYPN